MRLQSSQIKKLSDIFEGIGQVMVASIVLPFLLDTFNPLLSLTGGLLALAAWVISLLLLEERLWN
jgi:hypothetical protein